MLQVSVVYTYMHAPHKFPPIGWIVCVVLSTISVAVRRRSVGGVAVQARVRAQRPTIRACKHTHTHAPTMYSEVAHETNVKNQCLPAGLPQPTMVASLHLARKLKL